MAALPIPSGFHHGIPFKWLEHRDRGSHYSAPIMFCTHCCSSIFQGIVFILLNEFPP